MLCSVAWALKPLKAFSISTIGFRRQLLLLPLSIWRCSCSSLNCFNSFISKLLGSISGSSKPSNIRRSPLLTSSLASFGASFFLRDYMASPSSCRRFSILDSLSSAFDPLDSMLRSLWWLRGAIRLCISLPLTLIYIGTPVVSIIPAEYLLRNLHWLGCRRSHVLHIYIYAFSKSRFDKTFTKRGKRKKRSRGAADLYIKRWHTSLASLVFILNTACRCWTSVKNPGCQSENTDVEPHMIFTSRGLGPRRKCKQIHCSYPHPLLLKSWLRKLKYTLYFECRGSDIADWKVELI